METYPKDNAHWRFAEARPAPRGHNGQSLFDNLYRMRILVVNGNRPELLHLKSMLVDGGFRNIVTADCGQAAMAHLHGASKGGGTAIDMVLLDVPNTDGYAVGYEIRKHGRWDAIPIIMINVCSSGQNGAIHASYGAGATDIIVNRLSSSELIPRVTSALLLKIERDLHQRREQEMHQELAKHKGMKARLQFLTEHDELTGLYNRGHLEQLLNLTVSTAPRQRRPGALIYLDLDEFKLVNQVQGYGTGDRLLLCVAEALKREIHFPDMIARVTSGSFAVLIGDTGQQQALHTAGTLRKAINQCQPVTGKGACHVGVSIGVAMVLPEAGITASELLAHAGQACRIAKTLGGDRVQLFDEGDVDLLVLHHDTHSMPLIRNALANDRLRLVYQPIIDAHSGQTKHYEALVRMLGEQDEWVEPAQFIPSAERMGLMHEIDLWTVERVIDCLAQLPASQSQVSISANLSTHSLQAQGPALVRLVRDRLQTTGVSPERVIFEITETAAIANFVQTRNTVGQLQALGCLFALDDFGAGFDSYKYLKYFPVDYLKIDGTFIVDLVNDPVDQALVKSMIEIAHTLGKKAIAEFVENAESLEMLKDYGVDYVQGYYLGEPRLQPDNAGQFFFN